jgi:hypothetical protein
MTLAIRPTRFLPQYAQNLGARKHKNHEAPRDARNAAQASRKIKARAWFYLKAHSVALLSQLYQCTGHLE